MEQELEKLGQNCLDKTEGSVLWGSVHPVAARWSLPLMVVLAHSSSLL